MIYLIDFENVHEEGFSALGRLGDKDAVYCFFTKNVAKISMSALAGIRSGQLHFVEAESGKQSLDLALVSFLGYLIGTRPQELYYDIVSNDNGFQKAADFWNRRGGGLRVRVRKTNDLKPRLPAPPKTQILPSAVKTPASAEAAAQPEVLKPTAVEAAPSDTPAAAVSGSEAPAKAEPVKVEQARTRSSSRRGRRQNGKQSERQQQAEQKTPETQPSVEASEAVKETPVPAAAAEPAAVEASPAAPAARIASPAPAAPKSFDPQTIASLETAGVSGETIPFLQAQVDKYRGDHNWKQLVYRAVVKKFGQKNGTQIYNSAKKHIFK